MIIYISGPITNNIYAERDFKQAEKELLTRFSDKKPLTILNPMRFSKAVIGSPLSYNEYLQIDMKLISLCSHVYFLKNWESSYGCQIEYKLAKIFDVIRLYQE